jgi:hypothetical protein
VSGKVLTFTAGGHTVCNATTNSSGQASCAFGFGDILATIGAGLHYGVSYAGDDTFQSSSATGSVLVLLGIKLF